MVKILSLMKPHSRIVARMAELADAPDSKSGSFTRVGVRPSLRAPVSFLVERYEYDEFLRRKFVSFPKFINRIIDLTEPFTLTIVSALIRRLTGQIILVRFF
jgi:hypothetical protein